MKINTFKYLGHFNKPSRGINDYFHLMIYACNYVGFSIRLMGYGFDFKIQVYDPTRGKKE
jgi:hypothetical protein